MNLKIFSVFTHIGNDKSLEKKFRMYRGGYQVRAEKIIKGGLDSYGYPQVNLSKKSIKRGR